MIKLIYRLLEFNVLNNMVEIFTFKIKNFSLNNLVCNSLNYVKNSTIIRQVLLDNTCLKFINPKWL